MITRSCWYLSPQFSYQLVVTPWTISLAIGKDQRTKKTWPITTEWHLKCSSVLGLSLPVIAKCECFGGWNDPLQCIVVGLGSTKRSFPTMANQVRLLWFEHLKMSGFLIIQVWQPHQIKREILWERYVSIDCQVLGEGVHRETGRVCHGIGEITDCGFYRTG